MGEPSKVLLLEKVVEVVKRDKLLENVQVTGKRLMEGLKDLSNRFPVEVHNVRGIGTFCAFDCDTAEKRDEIVARLKTEGNVYFDFGYFVSNFLSAFICLATGIQSGGCGDKSVRLRPALIFQPYHADIFLERLERVLRRINLK
jgi:4-aminobutyrate aminotransferase / (S)-3-amino-2-methylpropionate transaminase